MGLVAKMCNSRYSRLKPKEHKFKSCLGKLLRPCVKMKKNKTKTGPIAQW